MMRFLLFESFKSNLCVVLPIIPYRECIWRRWATAWSSSAVSVAQTAWLLAPEGWHWALTTISQPQESTVFHNLHGSQAQGRIHLIGTFFNRAQISGSWISTAPVNLISTLFPEPIFYNHWRLELHLSPKSGCDHFSSLARHTQKWTVLW